MEPAHRGIIYEAWGTIEDGASTISTPENCKAMSLMGMMEEGEIALFSIRAASWTEAMEAYHDIQGWGPYNPPA